ncbi:hypothetical protein FRB93_012786 [Tulasnella sp. JGI-2019a]|nr:hypothetical protein FRB93_012786 [Tulasnella sp. JGI-2019a]
MHALVAFVACLSLTLYATPVPATSPGEISSLPDVISPDQPDNVKGRVRELGRIIERPLNIVVDWSLLSNEEIDQIVPSRFNPDKISKSKVFTKYGQLQLLKPMAIIRVTNDPNPDPALLTRAAFLPRFRSSLSLLQYLRDVHSDTQSAKALAVYVLRLGKREEELKRAEARAYQRLLARSSTYQIMSVSRFDRRCARAFDHW